jgi:hypothetical protein
VLRGRVARELLHASQGTTRRKGQIDLFTRRVRKLPPAPEFALQCMVADILRRWLLPGWRFTHIPSGEERPSQLVKGKRVSFAAARLKRAGLMPGWPDLILLSPTALAHFLELKRRGRGLDDEQTDFARYCAAHGYPHAWTDRFDEAVETLKRWGALPGSVHA